MTILEKKAMTIVNGQCIRRKGESMESFIKDIAKLQYIMNLKIQAIKESIGSEKLDKQFQCFNTDSMWRHEQAEHMTCSTCKHESNCKYADICNECRYTPPLDGVPYRWAQSDKKLKH